MASAENFSELSSASQLKLPEAWAERMPVVAQASAKRPMRAKAFSGLMDGPMSQVFLMRPMIHASDFFSVPIHAAPDRRCGDRSD
jgi:hypothetical protein